MSTTDRSPLPRAEPAVVGIPAASLLALLDGFHADGLEMHSLMVVRHAQVVAEGWWAPYSATRPHLLYSVSKSFTSAAVGYAVQEGLFGLDDTLVSLLPRHVPDEVDADVASLTVRHLLTMTTGHNGDTLEAAWRLEPQDPVKGFLRVAPHEPVGSRHAYNNTCTYVLAVLVQERTGEHLLDYLRPRLLDPLGVGPVRWDNDIHGNALGFTGLHLASEALAAFGQLLLQRGEWRGRRLLPDGWVELATTRHIATNLDPDAGVDSRQGYGFQFWMSRHGYRADGAFGQLCLVVPEHDLVVVTTACAENMQAILTNVWDHLLPALDTPDTTNPGGSTPSGSQEELERRLGELALPVVDGARDGPAGEASFVVEDGGHEAPFAPGTTVGVRTGGNGWDITVVTGPSSLHFRCGHGAWAEGPLRSDTTPAARAPEQGKPAEPVPVAASGGWTAPDTFQADLVLLELSHRIRLVCADGRARAAWNAAPLGEARLEAHLR